MKVGTEMEGKDGACGALVLKGEQLDLDLVLGRGSVPYTLDEEQAAIHACIRREHPQVALGEEMGSQAPRGELQEVARG